MQKMKVVGILTVLFLLAFSAVSVAEQHFLGVADTYKVSFAEKVWVANTLLPQGDYQIRHVMEGQDHIMVFHQLRAKKPIEVRAKCTLISLPVKANADQRSYTLNAANERVLHELIFRGDEAKHVF